MQNIAFLWSPTEKYGLLPGGGIEKEETPEEAFIRECKEEIGCDVAQLRKQVIDMPKDWYQRAFNVTTHLEAVEKYLRNQN